MKYVQPSPWCWVWTGAKDQRGYGQIKINGKARLAHRVVYELAYGAIPSDAVICHYCDNASCVAPHHLFPGTHEINRADCVAKGRHVYGSRNGRSKLTEANVIEAKILLAAGKRVSDIARKFNVSDKAIRLIRDGKNWRSVGGAQ